METRQDLADRFAGVIRRQSRHQRDDRQIDRRDRALRGTNRLH